MPHVQQYQTLSEKTTSNRGWTSWVHPEIGDEHPSYLRMDAMLKILKGLPHAWCDDLWRCEEWFLPKCFSMNPVSIVSREKQTSLMSTPDFAKPWFMKIRGYSPKNVMMNDTFFYGTFPMKWPLLRGLLIQGWHYWDINGHFRILDWRYLPDRKSVV